MSRARDLLMDGAIAADDFKEMKSSCSEKLLRIEAKQLEMANENKDALDIQGISNQAMRNFMHLNLFLAKVMSKDSVY